eukprot:gene20507-22525_t
MDSRFPFTEDEVSRKLAELGYRNISKEKMHVFMKDMEELVRYESLKCLETTSSNASTIDEEDLSRKSKREGAPGRIIKKRPHVSQLDKENLEFAPKFPLSERRADTSSSSSVLSDSNLDLSTASSVMRRKVARKKDGRFHVFDETFTTETESEASDITILEERLQSLPLRDNNVHSDDSYEDAASTISTSSTSLPRNKAGRPCLPSYIRPAHLQPHRASRPRKFDPVNRYHQFKEEWKMQAVPGENKHNNLRWNVREQMLNCETFQRPTHSHKQNNYKVPTEKKRQALRWEVRSALART